MSYRIELSPAAERDFRAGERSQGPHPQKNRPTRRPHGVEKLQGAENAYRIRVGNYRILYRIFGARLLVSVIRLGDRKDIYRHAEL